MKDRSQDADVLDAVVRDIARQAEIAEKAHDHKNADDAKAMKAMARRVAEIAQHLRRERSSEQASKAERRRRQFEGASPKPKRVSPSEALFAFASWLTTRPTSVTVGAEHNAGEMAELVDTYCRAQGWGSPRDGWEQRIASMPAEQGRVA